MEYELYCENLLNGFVENHVDYFPDYVYKYYDFNGGYLSLKNLTLQFTHPSNFVDKSECRKDRIKFKNQGKRIREGLLSREMESLELKLLGKNIDASSILKLSYKDIEKRSENEWENTIFKTTGVTCFTTLENNNFHWENYANNYSGICVKYNFKLLMNHFEKSDFFKYCGKQSLNHGPIIYVDEIMPVRYGNSNCEKLLMSTNWIFVKERRYQSEKEYRLYSQNCKIDNGYQRVNILKETIDEVFVGKNIAEEDLDKIKSLGYL